jgi:hypothetical protein
LHRHEITGAVEPHVHVLVIRERLAPERDAGEVTLGSRREIELDRAVAEVQSAFHHVRVGAQQHGVCAAECRLELHVAGQVGAIDRPAERRGTHRRPRRLPGGCRCRKEHERENGGGQWFHVA